MKRVAAAVVAMVIVLAPAPAAADGPEDRAASLSTRLMSPFCPGLTIHDCPTRESEELRAQMIEWAQMGWSNERIVDRLRAQYGPAVEPIPRDSNAYLVWAIPGVALLAGIVLAYFVARRWTREGVEVGAKQRWESSTSEERQRLESELNSVKRHMWGRT